MKKLLLLGVVCLLLSLPSFLMAQTSTLYFTNTGGNYPGEKWISITTGPDNTGTVIWAQGNGTIGDGSGLLTDQAFTVTDGVDFYINCYDQYDDSWDGTTYEVRDATGGGGLLVANNGGASPTDGADTDATFNWDATEEERETSELANYTPPACPGAQLFSATNVTENSADLAWTGGATCVSEEYWIIVAGTGPPTAGSGTANSCGAMFTESGLAATTDYEVYVDTDCGGTTTGPELLGSFTTQAAAAGCVNGSAFGTANLVGDNVPIQISSCSYTTEYSTVNGVTSGESYDFSVVGAGVDKYVTITDGTNNIIDFGPSPFTWVATVSGTVRAHWTEDQSCNTATTCHVTTVTCTTCPGPCSVDAISAAENGDCDPVSGLYSATVMITATNPVMTGDLDVNGQLFPSNGMASQTVILTGLVSDGMPVDVTAFYVDNSACTFTQAAAFTAPADCIVGCGISSLSAMATACTYDVATGATYSADVTLTYSNPPAGGTLDVTIDGITVNEAITTSPQIVTVPGLTADGMDKDVAAAFSMDATCTLSEMAVYTAPADCSPPANDMAATATDLTAEINGGAYVTGDNTTDATDGANPFSGTGCNTFDSWCNANPAYRDLWYSVTPSVTGCFGFLSVSTAGSSFDTKIAIYDNDMTTVISGNDDYHGFGGGYASLTTAAVTAGNTYYIQVAGYSSGDAGDITLDIVFEDITESTANGEGNKTADFECTGADGWTHYVNTTDGEVLLSIEKNGENLGWIPMTTSSCELEAGSTAIDVGTGGCGAFYATSPEWVIMNRTWDFSPSTQPAAPVNIRFYYANADLNDINAIVSTPISHASMVHYKISSGEENLVANACHADNNGGTASYEEITAFTNGMCGSYTYAEYAVSSFSGGGGGGGPTGSALPIKLDRFTAKADGRHNMIEWSTASEINVQDHTLMKSIDAQNWEILGITDGEVNSTEIIDYEMMDVIPHNLTYYQLMTTDLDGTVAYSPIVSVARDADEVSAFLGASPVPTSDVVNLNIYSQTDDNLTITLTDISGKRVMVSNKTITQGNHQLPLDLSNMTNGVYLVTITSDFISQTERVIKN